MDLPDEFLNATVVFGLKAQGHLPTIEKMLADGRSWDEIGVAIGWCPETAQRHYGYHIKATQRKDGDNAEVHKP